MEWTKLAESSMKVGYRKLLNRTYRLPDGTVADFTIKDESPSVCILALTQDNHVIIAKQFRPGPEEVLLELPGGGVETGELALDAAARELLEETGYAGDIRHVTTCLDSGYSTMRRECFVATNCKKIAEPHLDEHEFVETELMPLTEFRTHLRSGKLTVVEVGYLGLDFLGLL